MMLRYNVSFVKNLLNANGQAFKCVQDVIAVEANSPDEAVNVAKLAFEHRHGIGDWKLHADTVEITQGGRNGQSSKWGRRRRNRYRVRRT